MPFLAQQRIQCVECDNVVYPMELVTAGQYHYHKNCFQCAHCNRKLSLTNYVVSPSGIPYCKPHYIQILKQRGNFENFAIGRVSPSTEVTTSSNQSAQIEGTEVDSKRVVTSTKPPALKPINRQRSVSASSLPLSASSSSSASSAAAVLAPKCPQKLNSPNSHVFLSKKRSASASTLSESSGESSTVTSQTDVKLGSEDTSSMLIIEQNVENTVSHQLVADLQLSDDDECTKL